MVHKKSQNWFTFSTDGNTTIGKFIINAGKSMFVIFITVMYVV